MNALERVQDLLADDVQSWHVPEDHRLDAVTTVAHLLPAIQRLQETRWGYLATITGLDSGGDDLEVLYHFCADAAVLTLRVPVPRDEAAVPTICPLVPYAGVFERELSEMFGVNVEGAPDTSRLFLPDDWPEGVYPLRKTMREASDEQV